MSIKQYKITWGGGVRACANEEFVMESFPAKPLLNYALEVEKITSKKQNLILSVISKPNFIFIVVLLDTQYSLDHSY
jgi:hypothetical protein